MPDLPRRYVRSGHVNGEVILITDVETQMSHSDGDRIEVYRQDHYPPVYSLNESDNPVHHEFIAQYAKVHEFRINRMLPAGLHDLQEVVHTEVTRMAVTQEVDKLMSFPFAAITELEEQNNQLRSITDRYRREIKEFENMSFWGRIKYLWSGMCQAITRK